MSDTFDRLKAALADRYALEREIGAGGMATVYLAEDLKHHRKVAVKVLRPDLAAALGPERFLREIEIAANLTHPHIVPLYDSGEAEGFLYYVLPYIEGESLRAKLAREGELPITDAVRILRDVVDALTDAHAHGIVHRDIKPDNVLLTKHHAVVTDFGVAKAVSEATGREKLTTAGVALGTPAYMAPEQAVADPHVDHRADIYAVGAVAYELLTGRPPFTGTTPQMVLSAHVTEVPEPVNKDRQAVPPALAQLVMKCLEKKPADRWQSAEELLPQLEALATPSGGITPTGTLPVEAVPGAAHKRPRYLIPVATVAVATVIGAAAWLALGLGDRERGQATAVSRQSVAVLPFTSVRSDEESQAFTTGIHGDILTQLSKIGALKVISRTSVLEYENTTKNIRQIGEELGVATVLEGAVQRAGNQLRINLQLIDALSDEPLWAETYNREWTVDNLFAIQSDVAQRVAAALQATLSAEERARIGSRPTGNLEAYEAYQRGNEYEGRSAREQDIRLAIRHYEQAVQLDGNFALAHARLSRVHSKMWWYFYDRDEARLALAKQAVDRALALDPDLPEAHMALGYYYYWGFLEFDRALAEFAITERAQPNNALLFNGIGSVHRRRGEMEKALRYYQRQLDLSPRSLGAASAVAETHALLRNSAEAQRYWEMVIALRPELAGSYSDKAASYLRLDGDPQRARDVLDRADVLGLSRPGFSNVEFRLDVVEGNYQAALGRLPAASTDIVLDEPYFYVPAALRYAQLYAFMGNRELTRAYYDTARVVLERVVRERPDDARLHMTLGFVYGGLGRKADAIREGKRGVELRPVEKDALLGASAIEELARIYALVGEVDAAVEQLELLFSIPWDIDIPYLKIDPTWAPLTDHPGFRRLLASEN